MTKTIFENGSSAGASYGNQWQQAADVVISGAQHAPGLGVYLGDAEVDLQTAATAAKAKPGATLKLAPGKTYTVSAAVDVTGLTVDMAGATVKVADGIVAPNVFVATGSVTILGGTIDGNKANTTDPGSSAQGNGLFAHGSSWGLAKVAGTIVQNCWENGVSVQRAGSETDASLVPKNPVLLESVQVSGCGVYGVTVSKVGGLSIRDCHSDSNGTHGFLVSLCRDVKVDGGGAESNHNHGLTFLYSWDSDVSGFAANSNTQHGICYGGNTQSATNTASKAGSITGCTTRFNGNCGICIDLTITGATTTPVVWEGAITGCKSTDNTVHGLTINEGSRVQVTGGLFRGNQNDGIALNNSNLCGVTGNSLIGNTLHGIAQNASGAAPAGQFYGRHQIGGNVYDSNGIDDFFSEDFHEPASYTVLGTKVTVGAAAPTTGTWGVGDQCHNIVPASGSPIGWVCTVAGTPGTWAPMPNLP